jgi:hypothetical protein
MQQVYHFKERRIGQSLSHHLPYLDISTPQARRAGRDLVISTTLKIIPVSRLLASLSYSAGRSGTDQHSLELGLSLS